MSTQLATIEKKTYPIIEEAKALEIVDVPSMERATELLSQFNFVLKASEKDRREQTDPIEEGLEKIRAKYRPLETALKDVVKSIRTNMSEYQTRMDREAEEKAKKFADRVGDGPGKLKPETASRKISEIETAPAVVETKNGKVSFREDKILKVIDISKIPREYFILDESKLLKDLKAGVKVKGAEVEIIKTPINRR